MNDSCPIQTPAERARNVIIWDAKTALMAKVLAALKEADETATAALRASGTQDVTSLHGYFTSSLHQKLYCILCGADPETFQGGNAKMAITIIRNSQQIAKHYWGAELSLIRNPGDHADSRVAAAHVSVCRSR